MMPACRAPATGVAPQVAAPADDMPSMTELNLETREPFNADSQPFLPFCNKLPLRNRSFKKTQQRERTIMSEFAPPAGPPPPKVPEGWKAIWNTQYNEWFYVNIYTKSSQWEKPTEPIYPPGESLDGIPPQGPPPTYGSGNMQPMASEKTGLSSNNPYAGQDKLRSSNDMNEDERLARQLQAEEDARVRSQGGPAMHGTSNDYYGNSTQQPSGSAYPPNQTSQMQPDPYTGAYDTSDKGKHKSGLAGKASSLLNKLKSSSAGRPGGHPQMYGGPAYGHRPAYGYGHQGYYPPHGPPMMMGGGGRRPGGMGAGGAMALGGLGGLAGGALLGSAMAGDDGGDDGGYGGDDGGYGGGDDFGGGDFDGGGE